MNSHLSSQSRPDTEFPRVYNNDVLGNKGRKVLDACVKVKIYGKPETRRYDRGTAWKLFRGCYVHQIGVANTEFSPAKSETCSIVDIYNAMVKYENMPYVEIYPREGPGSEKTRELIDKRRADVERELEEARINPNGRKMYSWPVAQHRVRDCYAGSFPEDKCSCQGPEPFTIKDIKDVVDRWDRIAIEVFSDQSNSIDEKLRSHRAEIQKKYYDALASPGSLNICSRKEALESLKKCYSVADHGKIMLDSDNNSCYSCPNVLDFCIFKLYNLLCSNDIKVLQELIKYPAEGPGSEELKNSIKRHRADLEKEYQNFCNSEKSRLPVHKYSQEEAERRVRDCFASAIHGDSDVFPTKKDQSGMPKIYQTFDIFDIKQSLDYFDAKKLLEKYPEKGHISDEIKKRVDEQREHILNEYKTATTNDKIEHGSGFVISDHFILTNKHVIQTYLDKKASEIRISNAAIGELHCEVVHSDPGKDLALLYCPDLNLHQSRISPLQLSTQPLLPGVQIFSFGYPLSHTEETALFVNGNVSGSKRTLSGHSMVVLNCSLNSGNSGGPVLSWVYDEVRVVGIATQKHFKEILTPDEFNAVENIRKSLETRIISDVLEHDVTVPFVRGIHNPLQDSINLLTLKLYDALKTHSQFNLSNALPGDLVVEFIKRVIPEYNGVHKEELIKVVELSK